MEQFIDICPTCQNGSFDNEKCDADFNDVMFDGLAHRAIVDCHKYKEKPKHHLKITYECEGKIATFEEDVYSLPELPPGVKWKGVPTDYKSEFESIWKIYPRKKDKQKAYKAFEKARKKGIACQTIEQGVRNYIIEIEKQNIDAPYIKHFSTWLNGACWEDEPDRLNKKGNKDRLQRKPTYDLEAYKEYVMNNTEI